MRLSMYNNLPDMHDDITTRQTTASRSPIKATYSAVQQENKEFWNSQALLSGQAVTCRSDWIANATLRYLRRAARNHDRILELGCGDGNLLANLNVPATKTGLD